MRDQGNAEEVKRLQDEIQKLRLLNKNRSEILAEVEAKGKTLRDTETQLKLARNEMEMQDG